MLGVDWSEIGNEPLQVVLPGPAHRQLKCSFPSAAHHVGKGWPCV